MDIEKIKRRLLIKYPPFGSVVANSKFISEQTVKTAETDGKNIYYNPHFLETITEQQQTFIFAHEVFHIAFDHIHRSKGKDDELWNIATDAVTNAILKDDGLSLVDGFIDIPDAINYDAEEMYKKLLSENKQKENNNSNKSNNKGGHDSHSMWKKELEEIQESSTNKQIKKMSDLGEKEIFKQIKKERKKQLEELRKTLASNSHGHGNDTNSNLLNIKDIGISEPLIEWRRLLKEAVKYDVDWSYRNASIEDGVLTAHLEKILRPETEIVLDTSGSVNVNLLKNFLRECKNILRNSRVKVGCFDTKFYGFTEIKDISDIDNLKFYGGGGTDFEVAVGAFTNRVENKIIFTDGKSNMPELAIDVIWIVFGEKIIHPKGGRVINISNKQLRQHMLKYSYK